MSTPLTDAEWEFLRALPELDLVNLAVELDILVPAQIDARELIAECLARIIDRAEMDGLPFSKYDREDLEALPPAHLRAVASLQKLAPEATADQVLKAGIVVYRRLEGTRPGSAVALMLPSLLGALARVAAEGSGA